MQRGTAEEKLPLVIVNSVTRKLEPEYKINFVPLPKVRRNTPFFKMKH